MQEICQGIPHSYFKSEASRHCTAVEFRVLGIVLDETLNQQPPREWARIKVSDIEGWVGITEPSVIEALRNLAKKGLIQSRGGAIRYDEFRVVMDHFQVAEAAS